MLEDLQGLCKIWIWTPQEAENVREVSERVDELTRPFPFYLAPLGPPPSAVLMYLPFRSAPSARLELD